MPLNNNKAEIAFESPFSTLFDAPVAVSDQDMVDCIGVVGMPTDWTHSSRIGARHGPEALRRATTRIVREYLPASEETFFDALHGGVWRRNEEAWIADLGDASIDPLDEPARRARVDDRDHLVGLERLDRAEVDVGSVVVRIGPRATLAI